MRVHVQRLKESRLTIRGDRIGTLSPLWPCEVIGSDWTKNCCLYSAHSVSPIRSQVDLNLWPSDPKSTGLLLLSLTTYVWNLKVIAQKNLVCIMPKRFHRQSTEVDLDIETQNQKKGDPPIIVNNVSMRFQNWTQIVLCSMSTRSIRFVRQSRPWSLTLWPKIHRVLPLIINNICVKHKTNHPILINKHPSVTAYKAIYFSGEGLQNQREHHII